MKGYFKYFSIDQLREEIRGRFESAREKVGELGREGSVEEKFSRYVQGIRVKQQQYDSLMHEGELDQLLCQRRRKINQSLDRYERNSRSKTAARFFPLEGDGWKGERESGGRMRTESSAQLGREVEREGVGRKEVGSVRVASDNNVLKGIVEKKNLKQSRKMKERLKSITNVVNITIDSCESNPKLFSFAKPSLPQAKPSIPQAKTPQMHLQDISIQRAIRFETAPAQTTTPTHQFLKPNPTSPKPPPNFTEPFKSPLKSTHNPTQVQQRAEEKIKSRLKVSKLESSFFRQKSKHYTQAILVRYEWQRQRRMELKSHIASSSRVYATLKFLRQ